MNQLAIQLPTLVTASLTLGLAAIVAWTALAWLKPNNQRIYWLVWMAVLMNGMMLVRISVDVPVLGPESHHNFTSLFSPSTSSSEKPPGSIVAPMSAPANQTSGQAKPNLTEASTSLEPNTPSQVEKQVAMTGVDPSISVVAWLPRIWLTGFVLAIGYLALCYVRFMNLLASASAAPDDWSRHCDQIQLDTGLRRTLPMLVHDRLGPALILTPQGYRIVVPRQLWSQLNSCQQTAILRHEIEHYRRGDILTSLFASFVAAIHWFNPLAWLAVGKLNLAAEWACDSVAAEHDDQQSSYARALLSISTARTDYLVGAHGIGSSDLKQRVQHLLTPPRGCSRFGNVALLGLAIVILVSGWINLRLIASSAYASPVAAVRVDDAELEAKIEELAGKLSRGNELNEEFYRLAQSKAGRIAIGNAVGNVESQLRDDAAQRVVPEFFEKEVDAELRQQIAEEAKLARRDIEALSSVLKEIREKLHGQSDADKLFQRFITHENAATVLYFAEMRKQMRPGQQLLMRHLGRFLAKREDGKLIVRESAKATLIEKLKRFHSVESQIQFLRKELALLADELMEKDDLHKKLKQRMNSGRGAAFVLAHAFDRQDPLDNQITQYLESLEHFFVDAPDGLMIQEDAKPQLIEAMSEMDQMVAKMQFLKGPIEGIVSQIDSEAGQAEATVRNFLESEVGLAVLSLGIDIDPSGADGIGDKIKSEILQETDRGYVIREDRQEEVSQFSRELLRGNRNLRRQLRVVDSRVQDVPKQQLGDLLDSTESKLILVEKVQQFLQQRQFDAWPIWVKEHFEIVDGKYQLRSSAAERVKQLTNEADVMQQELKNDDF